MTSISPTALKLAATTLLAAWCAAGCTGSLEDATSGGSGAGAGVGNGSGATNGVGTGGAGNFGGAPGDARPLDLPGDPQYYRFVRLTNEQWAHSVRDALRLDALSGLESGFATAVAGTTDFTNNELVLDVSQRSWSDYQTAAETLSEQVTASDATLARLGAGTDAAGFIATVGRRLYRRPLSTEETARYQSLFSSGAALSGTKSAFAKGAGLVLRAMLQSPFFLYRTELGAVGAPLGAYEVAAKLSLWLRDTTPNDALLDAAAGPGRLDTAEGAVAIATQMLEEPAALEVMRRFHTELLHFDRYKTISKLNVPTYRQALNAELEESSHRFFAKIFSQGLGVREILTATSGFMGPEMAALYGLPAPPTGVAERELGAQRVGYFTQLPYLVLHAFNAEQDSIHRGVTINLDVLCANPGVAVPMLPPVPDLMPGQTNRERITTLTGGCGGECHAKFINPIGFAFERFDGMGQYREMEAGKPIDSSGTYPFMEGSKSFSGAAELMTLMASGEQAHACYAKKLASFALQRDVVASDLPLINALKTASLQPGGSIKKIIVELVRSPAFRTRGGAP